MSPSDQRMNLRASLGGHYFPARTGKRRQMGTREAVAPPREKAGEAQKAHERGRAMATPSNKNVSLGDLARNPLRNERGGGGIPVRWGPGHARFTGDGPEGPPPKSAARTSTAALPRPSEDAHDARVPENQAARAARPSPSPGRDPRNPRPPPRRRRGPPRRRRPPRSPRRTPTRPIPSGHGWALTPGPHSPLTGGGGGCPLPALPFGEPFCK